MCIARTHLHCPLCTSACGLCMTEEINKHMRGQRKGAETKGQMKRKWERLEERQLAWFFCRWKQSAFKWFTCSLHRCIPSLKNSRLRDLQTDRPCCMQTSWVAVMHYQTHIKTYAGTQRQQNPETEVGQANQLGLATFKKCSGVPLFHIRYDGCKGTCTLIYTV